MRALVLLAGLLAATAGLAGCFGSDPEEPTQTASTDPMKDTTNPASGGGKSNLVVLAPLQLTLTATSDKWIQSGSNVQVVASAPANAKGAVKYTWATGALPGTVAGPTAKPDTGSAKSDQYIAPGKVASLKFDEAGIYQMHCHPHAYMRSNVTVVDGLAPSVVDVQIVDGASLSEYRYFPENVVVGKGSTVRYHNNGTAPHTATLFSAEPALKALDLKTASGEVKVDGTGWQRVVVIAQDAEGRIGRAEYAVYATAALPAFEKQTFPFTFNAGYPAGAPEQASTVQPPGTKSFKIDYNGSFTLNFSAVDAAAANGAPVNNAQVEIHLFEQGQTQDSMTSDPTDSGSLVSRLTGGKTYTLQVIPRQGAGLEVEVTLEGVYDLEPPAPAMASAGGGHDEHSGHAH